ncbi:three-Cys-motif partner protein TcmP [Seleniivibrio woodruffii]|uniref:three-Cys-motif partner protein TcmP n=1 Tax=Seleniivibrio woodruffii TaxID=1078050 RepID=UPI0026F031F0|nr:three-Cys-motif partner protein TcmP [Seleniivibrio woodruffii]
MGKTSDEFFQSKTTSSSIKTKIVTDYYSSWIEKMMNSAKSSPNKNFHETHFGYIDLYAGAGAYKDGSHGTAMSIMSKIVQSEQQRNCVEAIFNDSHKASIESLSGCVGNICSNLNFRYPPQFTNQKVDVTLVNNIFKRCNFPTLLFLDPFGYKGLSLESIRTGIEEFGSDCFIFFNYVGVIRALRLKNSDSNLAPLFGDSYISIKQQEQCLSQHQKQNLIVESFKKELTKLFPKTYVSHFRFLSKKANCTQHYLFHITKSEVGYLLFKDIIRKINSDSNGFPIYEYNPRANNNAVDNYITNRKEDLACDLLSDFKGEKITFNKLFKQHHIKTNYCRTNYCDTIKYMVKNKRINLSEIKSDGTPRGKAFCEDAVVILFP